MTESLVRETEIIPSHTPQRPVPTAEKAGFFFERASNKYFRSGTAQSARLAQLCRRENYSPIELRDKLWHDKAERVRLVDVASQRHAGNANAPNRPMVKALILRNIVHEFTLASQMMHLSDAQIEDILTKYEDYKGQEDSYKGWVNDLLNERGITAIEKEEAQAMVEVRPAEAIKMVINAARRRFQRPPRSRHAAGNNQAVETIQPAEMEEQY